MRNKRKIFCWLITGVFFSLAVSAMVFTGDGSLNQFYDNGYVWDLKEDWKRSAYYSNQYDSKSNSYTWSEGDNPCYVGAYEWNEEIRYLLLDTEYVQGANATWRIYYKDHNNNDLSVEEFAFKDGESVFPIQQIENSRILIFLVCTENTEYRINNMYLAEYTVGIPVLKVLYGAIVYLVLYCMISIILVKVLKFHLPNGNVVQTVIEYRTDKLLEHMNHTRCRESYAGWVRTSLLVAVVIVWRLANEYDINRYYGYAVFAHMIFFLALISWIPLEEHTRNADGMILKMWLWLYGIQIFSDILLRKNFGFAGIWILLSFGLLFYAWRRMERPEDLLEDFLHAMEILYLINIVYCFFGDSRSYQSGLMDGTWGNTNPFSITIVLYLTIMLFRLYQTWKKKRRWYYYAEGLVGTGLGVWMLYEASCRTAWLAYGIICACFIWILLRELPKEVKRKKYCWLMIIAIVILCAVYLNSDKLMAFLGGAESGISFNSMTSGRILIWKEYLKEMNLIGHTGLATIGTLTTYAHNGLLKLMYKYGSFIGIIVIMLAVEIGYGIVKMWRNSTGNPYVFLVTGVVLAYIIPVSLEATNEYPMVAVNWFAFYFMLGYIMQKKDTGIVENDG